MSFIVVRHRQTLYAYIHIVLCGRGDLFVLHAEGSFNTPIQPPQFRKQYNVYVSFTGNFT